jgi:hypothetical protein
MIEDRRQQMQWRRARQPDGRARAGRAAPTRPLGCGIPLHVDAVPDSGSLGSQPLAMG